MSAAYRFSRFEEEGNFRTAGNGGEVNDEVEARKKPRGSDLAVCVPPLYRTITPATLVQFVELTRVLGDQHFVFYVGDVSDCLRRVLGAYEAEAVATTIPWAIPPAVAQSTIGDILRHRRLSLFSRVARLDSGVPAHDALRLMVYTYEGRKRMASWSRPSCRPRNVWLSKIQEDANVLLLSTLWRPREGSGIVRIDPLRFLAGNTRRLNQVHFVLYFSMF